MDRAKVSCAKHQREIIFVGTTVLDVDDANPRPFPVPPPFTRQTESRRYCHRIEETSKGHSPTQKEEAADSIQSFRSI
jgi:hypothetical protein